MRYSSLHSHRDDGNEKRASAFVSLFMGPLQGGIAAFAVETAFLMLGRMAFMMHTINVMMGKCDE